MTKISAFFKEWNNHKKAALSMAVSLIFLSVVLCINLFISLDDIIMNIKIAGQGPSLNHIFGVDWIGRDMFLRTMKGLVGSLRVGLIASVTTITAAIILAVISSVTNKKIDQFIGLMIDTFLGIPHLVLMVLISASLGGGELGVIVAVATTHWPTLTRILRAEILQIREEHFVHVSKQLGHHNVYIAKEHIFWHLLPQIIIRFVLLFPHVILHEAAITFLGFGLSPMQPAIGVILSESVQYISAGMWWLVLFPGLALLITVMCFESIGESTHEILNPNTSKN